MEKPRLDMDDGVFHPAAAEGGLVGRRFARENLVAAKDQQRFGKAGVIIRGGRKVFVSMAFMAMSRFSISSMRL